MTTEVTLHGVTLQPHDPLLHRKGSVSRSGACGQGGTDTCHRPAMFSVTSERWSIAACPKHVFGAMKEAHTLRWHASILRIPRCALWSRGLSGGKGASRRGELMKEADVLARFAAYLDREGWEVPLTPRGDSPDVDARHRETGRRLVAEVKGHTAEPGLDTDTAYGQLLRRMGTEPEPATRYALVMPESLRGKAERVPAHVRETLRVELWLVSDDGPPYPV